MKRTGIISVFLFLILFSAYAEDSPANPYTQLIGFKAGGEFFVNNFLSDWSTGVFFENVIAPWFGLEIEMAKSSIPVTNYSQQILGTTVNYYGQGKRDYIEMSGALKFYIKGFSVALGISYNDFISGYIIDKTVNTYVPMSDQEINFFSVFLGPELTAQISSDLYTRVGIKAIYGIITADPNYTFGVRFYISFAYGI